MSAVDVATGGTGLLPRHSNFRYPDVESLRALFRTGRRPDGSAVAVMPFESLARLSELGFKVDVRLD